MSDNNYSGIAVVIEQREGVVHPVSFELLGKASKLADDRKAEVIALIAGSDVRGEAAKLFGYGADRVLVVEDDNLEHYINEAYTKAYCATIKALNPEIVLFGATAMGRDLAPRVSARIHTGLTADCTSLDIDSESGNLLMTRPAFGGNIMATIICPDHRPQMSTVRPGVMLKQDFDSTRSGELEFIDAKLNSADKNVEVLEVVRESDKRVNIEDASVLVSAGRGVGSPDAIPNLEALAKQLGAEVSGSRAVIDAGWLDKGRQVGQTGKTVRPDLYFALGISGQIQHLAGMEDSNFIIAVNKNPEAPIFDVADIGIVGDLNKLVPAIIAELEKTSAEAERKTAGATV